MLQKQRQDSHLNTILSFPVQQLIFGNAFLRGRQPRQQDAGIRLSLCLEVSWLGRNWGQNTQLVPAGRCREGSCAALQRLCFTLGGFDLHFWTPLLPSPPYLEYPGQQASTSGTQAGDKGTLAYCKPLTLCPSSWGTHIPVQLHRCQHTHPRALCHIFSIILQIKEWTALLAQGFILALQDHLMVGGQG